MWGYYHEPDGAEYFLNTELKGTNQDSAASITTGLWAVWSGVQNPGIRNVSLLQNVHTSLPRGLNDRRVTQKHPIRFRGVDGDNLPLNLG
jgi:hypothetical protein